MAKPSPTDHPFDPRDEWWSLCQHCGLARAAHLSSTQKAIDEMQAHFATLPRAKPVVERSTPRERARERARTHIAYVGDDDDD